MRALNSLNKKKNYSEKRPLEIRLSNTIHHTVSTDNTMIRMPFQMVKTAIFDTMTWLSKFRNVLFFAIF